MARSSPSGVLWIAVATSALCAVARAQDQPLTPFNPGEAAAKPRAARPADGGALVDGAGALTESRVAELIAQLGADDFDARERALAALCATPLAPEALVRAVPAGLAMTPEMATRFETALVSRFERMGRAGLGTGFAREQQAGGVLLQMVMPEFPASEFLKANDLIVEVDGEPVAGVEGQMATRAAILSRDPGETLPMTVVREGRRITMKVPLGSFNDLNNPGALDYGTLAAAWDLRKRRLGLESLGSTSTGQIQVMMSGPWPQQLVPRRTPGAINVIAGGVSGAGADTDRFRRKTVVGSQQALGQRLDALAQQRESFLRLIDQQRDRAEMFRIRLKDPNLSDREREVAERMVEECESRADELQQALQRILEQNGLP